MAKLTKLHEARRTGLAINIFDERLFTCVDGRDGFSSVVGVGTDLEGEARFDVSSIALSGDLIASSFVLEMGDARAM